MKTTKIKNAAVAAAATVAVGLVGAPFAAADDAAAAPTKTTIGQQGKLVNGDVVQSWTVTGLKPSSDVIPYTPRGTLWEATATDEAVQGSVQPIVSNFNARSADGENYRVLFGVATDQGVNPSALAQGEKTTGKVYFDVTGASPDRVVYNSGGRDLLVWEPAPPAPASTGTHSAPSSSGTAQRSPSQAAPAATAATPAATPAATGSQGTPAATGSQGTPAATGSQGTPATAATEGAPAATSEGTPAPAATGSQGTPATAGTEGTPAANTELAPAAPATGSQGTPVDAQTAPAPAAGDQAAPAPAASQGTPVVEETPVVGVPHGPGTTHPVS